MEFKYHDGQNQMTPLPTQHPFSIVAYMNSDISGPSLQGSAFAPSSFPGNVSAPRVFPTAMPIIAEEAFWQGLGKEQIRRELEKEKIRSEIIAGEMALGRRRELEEEVRREMAAERTVGIPTERTERFSFGDKDVVNSAWSNQRMNNRVNNIDRFGGPQPQLPRQFHVRQLYVKRNTNNKGKEIVLVSVKCYV